jgi:hypothetical protein
MNLQVPQNVGKFLKSCTNGSFSRRLASGSYLFLLYVNDPRL